MNVEESKWKINRLLCVLMDDCLINNSCSEWCVTLRSFAIAQKLCTKWGMAIPVSNSLNHLENQPNSFQCKWLKSNSVELKSSFVFLLLHSRIVYLEILWDLEGNNTIPKLTIVNASIVLLLCLFWLRQTSEMCLTAFCIYRAALVCAHTHAHHIHVKKLPFKKWCRMTAHNARRTEAFENSSYLYTFVCLHMWKTTAHTHSSLSLSEFYSPAEQEAGSAQSFRKIYTHIYAHRKLHVIPVLCVCVWESRFVRMDEMDSL